MSAIRLIECPRDAFQGLHKLIPTETKIAHLQKIIAAGFEEIDFGSFVSPKAIPQMADTEQVLAALVASGVRLPRLIAIIANERQLERAAAAFGGLLDAGRPDGEPAAFVGYPFSIAETFQKNNTGKSIEESWELVGALQVKAAAARVGLVVYISMGFGNPYGEAWSPQIVADAAERLARLGVRTISLADTVGLASPEVVSDTFVAVRERMASLGATATGVEIGAHLHANPRRFADKIGAAHAAGCRRFDSALGGFGGCPFAQDELVGNVPTEGLIDLFADLGTPISVNRPAMQAALESARTIQMSHS